MGEPADSKVRVIPCRIPDLDGNRQNEVVEFAIIEHSVDPALINDSIKEAFYSDGDQLASFLRKFTCYSTGGRFRMVCDSEKCYKNLYDSNANQCIDNYTSIEPISSPILSLPDNALSFSSLEYIKKQGDTIGRGSTVAIEGAKPWQTRFGIAKDFVFNAGGWYKAGQGMVFVVVEFEEKGKKHTELWDIERLASVDYCVKADTYHQ